ncbi:MAG TPA: DNA mismatch repair protein MutS [Pirellulales bacterium]|jgi:DNA mismatch repair protein MutS
MSVSPMMKQYQDAKASCQDAILLFRMGDFYEMFFEDARVAARVLNLALTSREKGENAIPMAGFPYHQLESYLGKLVTAGLRVAVCDQVEDARQAKGLVRRDVTRIVSAGTLTDESLLDPRASNYLAAVVPTEPAGMAWIDLSTGSFRAACFPLARLADELARVAAAEVLLADDDPWQPPPASGNLLVTRRPAWAFAAQTAAQSLARHFDVATLEGFGFDDAHLPAIRAAGAVLEYLVETQKSSLGHIDRLEHYSPSDRLQIDEATRRSLELTRTLRDGRREGSLLAVLDRTATPMGSRLLAEWLANPLADRAAIDLRLDAVAELVAEASLTAALTEALASIYDLERLVGRVTTGRASPRDLSFVARTLAVLPQLKAKLTARRSTLLCHLEGEIDLCPDVRGRLETALIEDCPLVSREGGFIRPGFHGPLDALRDLASGGKQWIAAYQAKEAARTGIANLKVGFNKVFGYYLESTHAQSAKIPPEYIRKQTVKNAERYITPELKEYEEKVLSADEQSQALEFELFLELRDLVAAAARRLRATAAALAQLDVLAALADQARRRNYCRPTMVDEPVFEISDGRHPVLDALMPEGSLVPNDVSAGGESGAILLVTGPNMAGKSTFIRQVALLTLMAQMGSFVPARRATIGLADRIFARVGASDELARGQSTFMVEMTETARILNLGSRQSLVILDEIGRGTSTYDGLSLAWSVVEHLHDRLGCRTFFATHYHELTALAQSLPGVRNYNVAVREWQDEVVFLHKIVPGAADKSYGIHVARLAGIPPLVIERAKEILGQLENQALDSEGHTKIARPKRRSAQLQLSLFAPVDHPMLAALRSVDLDAMTPREALGWLQRWQEELGAAAGPAGGKPRPPADEKPVDEADRAAEAANENLAQSAAGRGSG